MSAPYNTSFRTTAPLLPTLSYLDDISLSYSYQEFLSDSLVALGSTQSATFAPSATPIPSSFTPSLPPFTSYSEHDSSNLYEADEYLAQFERRSPAPALIPKYPRVLIFYTIQSPTNPETFVERGPIAVDDVPSQRISSGPTAIKTISPGYEVQYAGVFKAIVDAELYLRNCDYLICNAILVPQNPTSVTSRFLQLGHTVGDTQNTNGKLAYGYRHNFPSGDAIGVKLRFLYPGHKRPAQEPSAGPSQRQRRGAIAPVNEKSKQKPRPDNSTGGFMRAAGSGIPSIPIPTATVAATAPFIRPESTPTLLNQAPSGSSTTAPNPLTIPPDVSRHRLVTGGASIYVKPWYEHAQLASADVKEDASTDVDDGNDVTHGGKSTNLDTDKRSGLPGPSKNSRKRNKKEKEKVQSKPKAKTTKKTKIKKIKSGSNHLSSPDTSASPAALAGPSNSTTDTERSTNSPYSAPITTPSPAADEIATNNISAPHTPPIPGYELALPPMPMIYGGLYLPGMPAPLETGALKRGREDELEEAESPTAKRARLEEDENSDGDSLFGGRDEED